MTGLLVGIILKMYKINTMKKIRKTYNNNISRYLVRDLVMALLSFYPDNISYKEIRIILNRVCGQVPKKYITETEEKGVII